jgi:hypothetical protein
MVASRLDLGEPWLALCEAVAILHDIEFWFENRLMIEVISLATARGTRAL